MSDTADLARNIEDRLVLSLRQCATHPAGPLRAVADFMAAVRNGRLDDDEVRALCESIEARMTAAEMPDDRRVVVEQFLAAIFEGILP